LRVLQEKNDILYVVVNSDRLFLQSDLSVQRGNYDICRAVRFRWSLQGKGGHSLCKMFHSLFFVIFRLGKYRDDDVILNLFFNNNNFFLIFYKKHLTRI
jgi:hypothetical protein